MNRHSGGGGQFSNHHHHQYQQYHQQQHQGHQQQHAQQQNQTPQKKYPGVTAPISLQGPNQKDIELTAKLEACLRSYDLFESEEEMSHRVNVLSQINVIAKEWIHQVSLEKKCTPEKAEQMSGKIFTFGSFRLGVHTKGEY
jgi:poly(A) polymerase